VRESPAIEVISRLRGKGARVAYSDPHVSSLCVEDGFLKPVEPTDQAVMDADCVLILTDHAEFDYDRIVQKASLVFDARNATSTVPAPEGRVIRL
jgi:UDP-N-acetyl-D-glucosamine dehydrogenase